MILLGKLKRKSIYSIALLYVKGRGNVFAATKNDAKKLANAVGNGRPIRDGKHKDVYGSKIGYFKHYHDGLRKGGHIFYVGGVKIVYDNSV